MTEINTQKFYQFLAGFQKDGGSWTDVADGEHGNSDGYVIKSEFRSFLNAEWNGNENGELTNDIINKFWKAIDTNTSSNKISGTKLKNLNALDKNEVENLDKRLEVYVQFDEFVANEVNIPTVLTSTGSQWKSDVVDQLSAFVEEFIKGGCSGDLESILTEALPGIANKCTAQYCAVEYQDSIKNGVLKDYPDYKVADDKTLQELINSYIATIDPETDSGMIKEDIMTIVNAYLSTAGLGDSDVSELDAYGLSLKDGLNDLQIVVITQTIKNDLANEAKKYDGYKEQFNAAVQKFIDAKIKEGGTFEELKAAAGEFANSEFKTQLDNMVEIESTYRDVKIPAEGETNELYNLLKDTFGEDVAKMIANRDRYVKEYSDIIDDVSAKVQAGELEMDEVENYIIEKLQAILEKFIGKMSNMSIEGLNTTYDMLAKAADAQEDPDEAIKQHREAAIKWCDAIAQKGSTLKAEISKVLEANGYSGDYKTAINEMWPDEIQTIMELLKAAVKDVGEVKSFTLADWDLDENALTDKTMATKESFSTRITATVKNGEDEIDPSRISYSVTATNGTATIDSLGYLNITAGDTSGYMKIQVYVMVDGIKIGEPKEISIAIDNNSNQSIVNRVTGWNGATSPSSLKTIGLNQDQTLTSSNFADLYNNCGIIQLDYIEKREKKSKWGARKDAVKLNLINLGKAVVSALTTAGLDKAKLEKATATVIDRFITNGPKTHENTSGSGSEASMQNKTKNYYALNNPTGIVDIKDTSGTNSHTYSISFKTFVDAILDEYNSLL